MLRFVLIVLLIAWATYLLVRAVQGRGSGPLAQSLRRPGTAAPRRRPPAKPRIVAPDDDEDFLRDLDRKRLHPEDPDA
ncbi:hypothetical protein K8Z61_09895 [Nocardioides sp. TRM66260-LWL]|uniref:hypothetical protein n=1 Tax=Nocardioides sp. TRM66260-LWL TaxID=2874478 RepID=UPI001CC34BA9|nr:hypothetical protein [Nocardioides sp. TRM66260-LWL]MBZ5734805.1 hypothetical protein [Nocardioides sp. TRM66260-LWL]